MRIEIDIPKEFEEHFKQDKFKNSFERIMADINHSLETRDYLCAGKYEYETIEMLQKAFENSKPAYSVDKVVGELEKIRAKKTCNKEKCDTKEICRICVVDDAIEIVKQGCTSDDCCEWIKYDYRTMCPKNHDAKNPYWRIPVDMDKLKYCPYCEKKIKVVDK